jgi:hypothetical protein
MYHAKMIRRENFYVDNATCELCKQRPSFEEVSLDMFNGTSKFSYVEVHTPVAELKGKTQAAIEQQFYAEEAALQSVGLGGDFYVHFTQRPKKR